MVQDDKQPTADDIEKLSKALKAEREGRKADAVALKEAQARIAEMEALGTNPNAEQISAHVQALVAAGVTTGTAELQAKLAELQTGLTTAQAEAQTAKQTLDSVRIASAVKETAQANFVKKECVPDLLTFAALELACDADGNVVSKDGVAVGDWLDAMKATRGYLWPPAVGSGGPNGRGARGSSVGDMGPTISNPFKADSWNMTRQGDIAKTNPGLAERLAAEAGVSLMLGNR